jgi:hypothetical protein
MLQIQQVHLLEFHSTWKNEIMPLQRPPRPRHGGIVELCFLKLSKAFLSFPCNIQTRLIPHIWSRAQITLRCWVRHQWRRGSFSELLLNTSTSQKGCYPYSSPGSPQEEYVSRSQTHRLGRGETSSSHRTQEGYIKRWPEFNWRRNRWAFLIFLKSKWYEW